MGIPIIPWYVDPNLGGEQAKLIYRGYREYTTKVSRGDGGSGSGRVVKWLDVLDAERLDERT